MSLPALEAWAAEQVEKGRGLGRADARRDPFFWGGSGNGIWGRGLRIRCRRIRSLSIVLGIDRA